ncbi:MAG: flagellar hook-length control protein FliK [Lachnospiraceae bacterium]|nr:flagellar hook-length control protein FliK [Lachnospiraceae bacterium]
MLYIYMRRPAQGQTSLHGAQAARRAGENPLLHTRQRVTLTLNLENYRKEERTGMTVNNVNALGSLGTVQGSQASAKPDEAVQDRFDKLMDKVSGQLASLNKSQTGGAQTQPAKQTIVSNAQDLVQPKDMVKTDNAVQTADTGKTGETSMDDAKSAVKQDGNGETSEVRDGNAQDAEAREDVEEAAEELVDEVSDVMDVPREKVEEAMEILGLTAVDLFDPANLKQLLLALTDSSDELSLVTDETLYGNLQDLFQTVNDMLGTLQEELGLDADELEALLAQISAEKQSVETQEPVMTPGLEEPEVSVEGMKDYAVTVEKEGGTVQVKVTVDDASGQKHVSEQMTDTAKPEVEPLTKKGNAGDTGKGESDAGQNAGNAFLQNLTGRTGEVEAPVERPVYTQPETNQIMDQIVEYMKINIKPETQELEMQLHPASLGTVHVQLAAKDGVITAQFAAQNETVKAVLETQLIQLKEQFEEQGIKVEAVEVTVANHAYGQQFGSEQEAANQENEGAKKNARRINLNLDEMAEEGLEELDDSERIAVEMMQANGSTVDYMA